MFIEWIYYSELCGGFIKFYICNIYVLDLI